MVNREFLGILKVHLPQEDEKKFNSSYIFLATTGKSSSLHWKRIRLCNRIYFCDCQAASNLRVKPKVYIYVFFFFKCTRECCFSCSKT